MIRITIEKCPHGDTSNPIFMGGINIRNDGTGTPTQGNYQGVVFTKARRPYKTVNIQGFPRKRRLAVDLLYRILKAAVGDRND